MRLQMISAGYEIVPFEERADVYIINTCSVTNIADRKSRQMIHRARSKNPEAAFREFISRYFRCTNPFCGALLVVLSGLSEEQWSLLESVCRAICRSVLRSSTPPASKAVYSQVSLDREAGNRAAESGPRPGNLTAGKAPASKSRTAGAASRPGNHAAGTASGTKSRSSAPAPKK